jgi:hypothetical protein
MTRPYRVPVLDISPIKTISQISYNYPLHKGRSVPVFFADQRPRLSPILGKNTDFKYKNEEQKYCL